MTTKDYILIGLTVAVTILLFQLFKKPNESNSMKIIDSQNKSIEKLHKTVEDLTKIIITEKNIDSIQAIKQQANEIKLTINEKRLKDVPNNYVDLTKEQRRNRAINY